MKRSEAESLISDMFLLYNLENFSHKESGKRMLDFIERLGMLPPAYLPENPSWERFNGWAEVNEWEPEDDEK